MKRMVALAVALAALVVVLAASGNAPVTVSRSGNTDGVFPNRIVVGALSSQTGPLPADFAPVVAGASAYLAELNRSGGVNGRTIDLADSLDDFSSPSEDASQARTLVDEDHVFAVVAVATPLFTGASYLASHDVPTFGLNVNPNSQWGAGPSMFGDTGSYSDFSQPQLQAAFLAEQNHVTSAAVLAYNVAQSQQGCEGVENAFTRYGVHVGYEDTSIPAPAIDLHADVDRMKAAGVDMVVSCMDLGGNVLLAQTMQQAGLGGALQYWFDGYDPSTLSQFGKYMQNTYFLLSQVPFEVTQLYPGRYRGMDRFEAALRRYEPGTPPSGAALAGWMSADLFTTGLRAIGRDVTRTRLVAAINRLTNYTADGIEPPVDWKTAHSAGIGTTRCSAFVKVEGDKFVPVYGTAPSVFTCFPVVNPAGPPIVPVAPLPAGVPPLAPLPGAGPSGLGDP
ncbi:MAG: ABC transporter substrate-binding protein [Acidimicrobiales bacterium]|jgi:ABC-type branched-subunit amino acid transport system substrate-binding protein